MIFKKKSTLDKVLNTVEKTLDVFGNPSRGGLRSKRTKRLQRSVSLAMYVGPVLWANRGKFKRAADTALQKAQQRLDASKQVLNASFSAGKPEKGQEASPSSQPEAQASSPQPPEGQSQAA